MDANSSSEKQQSFAVVVLGDIGRSPRMQYHAISLQKQCNFQVSLVGYEGEKCIPAVESNNKIQIYTVKHFDGLLMLRKLLFPLYAALKVTILLLRLLITLLWVIPRPRAILVQNPPSIPSLAVVWFVCKLRQSHMIIDWHNLGYTVLGYSIGQKHPLVWLSKVYERFFGRLGSAHFCVTKAMSKWLKAEFGVEAMVLYDKPPSFFSRSPERLEKDLFQRLLESNKTKSIQPGTKFEELARRPRGDPRRPLLLVSSTSWTPDEDFGVLLRALAAADGRLGRPLVVCVTGKGPQKEMYERLIAGMVLKDVEIHTLWLEPEDYPLFLGACDLGVCLHKSTSGLDLPMKVLDMFGSGMPVCAVDFPCLDELVVHDQNGLVFENEAQLALQLTLLVSDDAKLLRKMRENVKAEVRWEENWAAAARPALARLLEEEGAASPLAARALLCLLAAGGAAAAAAGALGAAAAAVRFLLSPLARKLRRRRRRNMAVPATS